MNYRQAFFMAVVVGLIPGDCGASAQTFEPGTKQVSGQLAVERPSAVSKVKVWTRARWEAQGSIERKTMPNFMPAAIRGDSEWANENILSMISGIFSFIA